MRIGQTNARKFFAIILSTAAAIVLLTAAKPEAGKQPQRPAAKDNTAEALRLNNLGAAYMGQQRFADAARMFEQARALAPKLEAAELNDAIALLNEQKVDQSRAMLLALVKRSPRNARAWYNLGLLQKGVGDAKAALEAFEHAAELAPDDADAHYFVGASAAQAGEDQKAVAAFDRALKLNPYHASAEFGLARVYQHLGRQDQARKYLASFQQLTQSKLGTPMSLAYGDQGPLSLAEQARAPQVQNEPAIKVTFTTVNDSGITPVLTNGAPPANPLAAAAVCVLDYNGDGIPDVFIGDSGLYRGAANGKFENVAKQAGFDRVQANACAAGDFDNDGHTDLAVATSRHITLYRNQGDGTFKDVTETAGISGEADIAGLTWVDFDHDGDIDLYATVSGDARAGNNVLWRNNGNSTFTNWTAETALKGAGASVAAIPTDFNEDRAVDLLVTGAKTQLFINPREGKWPVHDGLPAQTVGAAIADFDKDGRMDAVVTEDHAPGIQLFRNDNGKSWTPVSLPDLHWQRAFGVLAFDYDNDGWIDIAAVGETADGIGELRVLRNEGAKGFRDVSAEVGADKIQFTRPRTIVAIDYDHDGDSDLIVGQQSAPPVVLRNDGGNQNHSLRVALKGLNDNKSAIGTKVEIYAGDLYQKFEYTGAGLMGQSSGDLLIGLGKREQADVLRVLWPTGVVQDEIELAANKTANILEIDRRGSSCPLLFAWDGHRYHFVADMLGAGVLGHWIAPHTRNIPDPTEYLKVADFAPAIRDGRLSFRLMEPMEEVVYVDQVRLLAIDHPAGDDVYPNEYFASNPPYPDFKVITTQNLQPVRAWDDSGRNVTELLARADHRYVDDMKVLPFAGFTKPHKLEIDLGQAYAGGPLRLLMTGYIEYFTATSMYAADQAHIQPFAPYVEAQDSQDRWVRVIDDMGFPAGLPRTMPVELTGKIPVGTRRLRITTNLQIYWDQVLVDRSASDAQNVVVRDVPLSRARLRFHGYPKATEGKTRGDLTYLYEDVSMTGPYSREIGAYTRPGDVTNILQTVDDRFAIFGSGEELAVDFDPASLPALRPGWKRDYFFFADGYEKDMDFYASHPNTVAPLPFRSMGVYPPKGEYPDDAAHVRYRLDYNTRFVTHEEPSSFRFDYRKPTP